MNAPKIRFPDYYDNYKKLKYGDVLKIKSGRAQKQVECENGRYPILGTGGEIGRTNFYLYDKPSVLIGRKGTINKPQYMESPFWTVDTLFYSEIFDTCYPKYLFYSFQNVNWKKYDESTGVPSLSCSTIEKVDCFIPKKDEQIKVSNFLSLLDKKIELQSKKIEDLKLFKKGLNYKLFSDCKEEYSLNDILEEYNKKTQGNNEYAVLSSTASGIYLQSDYFNKQAASQDTTGYKIIPRGYVTYRSMSDTGEFHFNEQNIIDYGIVSPAYPVFKINEKKVNKIYLLHYMNENKSFINNILSTKEGGTRFALSYSKLLSIRIKLPSIDKQNQYSLLICSVNKKIENENKKLCKLNELKKGLMQNMLV